LSMIKNVFRSTTTFSKVCPCDLLIFIANANFTGNCLLLNVNEYIFSQYKVMRLKKTISPILLPVKISHRNKLLHKSKI